MSRFLPPPGWPAPPEGWVPPTGWKPDPYWPPAPAGWQFWSDDSPVTGSGMVLPEPTLGSIEPKGFFARRHEAKAIENYQAELAEWTETDQKIQSFLEAARTFEGGNANDAPDFVLMRSERPLGVVRGSVLIEPRTLPGHWEGRSQGVSFHVAKGVNYRVGASRGHYVSGPSKPAPIDTGDTMLTNLRVVFKGEKSTREWLYDKLVGYSNSDDNTWTAIQVSNRQKTSGIGYGADLAAEFQFRLELALAIWRDDRQPLITALETQLADHAGTRPVLPT